MAGNGSVDLAHVARDEPRCACEAPHECAHAPGDPRTAELVPRARPLSPATAPAPLRCAGFGERAAAALIDFIIMNMASAVVQAVFVAVILTGISTTTLIIGTIGPIVVNGALALFYSVWLESSSWQATVGKKILGLQVVTTDGRRISFWRSSSRNVGKSFSLLILGIGYLMPLWTSRKQALHDKIARCLVVRKQTAGRRGVATHRARPLSAPYQPSESQHPGPYGDAFASGCHRLADSQQ